MGFGQHRRFRGRVTTQIDSLCIQINRLGLSLELVEQQHHQVRHHLGPRFQPKFPRKPCWQSFDPIWG